MSNSAEQKTRYIWFRNFCNEAYENVCDKIRLPFLKKIPGWFRMVIFIIIITFLVVWRFGLPNFINPDVQPATVAELFNNNGDNHGEQNQYNANGDIILTQEQKIETILHSNQWKPGFGNLSQLTNECNKITLPKGEKSGTMQYAQKLDDELKFQIDFQPLELSDNGSLNFVTRIHNVYELVIGDGDKRTVTLSRTTDKDPNKQELVTEASEHHLTSLSSNPDYSRSISINFEQIPPTQNGDENLQVKISVNYYDSNHEPQTDHFTYIFVPSGEFKNAKWLHLGFNGSAYQSSVLMKHPKFCED